MNTYLEWFAATLVTVLGVAVTLLVGLLIWGIFSITVAHSAEAPSACKPISALVEIADDHDYPMDTVLESEKAGFAATFAESVGFPLPADAKPIGLAFVEGPEITIVAIIEDAGQGQCVRYTLGLPKAVVVIARGRAGAGF